MPSWVGADTIRRTAQIRDRGPRRNAGNVKVRAAQTTANNDPKYIEDLASGMTHVVAFQRHRSRLRAVQFQVAQGTVALQRKDSPLDDELGEVSSWNSFWTTSKLVGRRIRSGCTCYGFEVSRRFRAPPSTTIVHPWTTGGPPSGPHPSTPTPMSTSSPSATSTTADRRPVPRAGGGDPPKNRDDGRPVLQQNRNDQPEDHPPSSTPAREAACRRSARSKLLLNCTAAAASSLAIRPFC